MRIRWMIRRDMLEVLEIERQSFEFPWTEEDFHTSLCQRNTIGLASEDDDQNVRAYMIYELHRSHIHLESMAVDPGWRRLGYGRALVEKLVRKLSVKHRTRITLQVRESNLAAQVFFRELGFLASRVVRNAYPDTSEDAYPMQFVWDDGREVLERFKRGDFRARCV
jgi:ribosomal-protein-alanine N-acetyltransferase